MYQDFYKRKNNNVDTDYYIGRAYELRSEHTAKLFSGLYSSVKGLLSLPLPSLFTGPLARS